VWDQLPREVQTQLIAKKARFFIIDAYQVARDTGMGSRMNTILQTCFFAISKVLPRDEAIEAIRESIRYTYGRKGDEVVAQNLAAVDETLAHMFEIKVPEKVTSTTEMPPAFAVGAPKFERDVLSVIYAGHGDEIPVSAFPVDGTFPTGTAKWEKRNIALEIPAWDTKICIQCGKCAMVCPHAVLRIKVYDSKHLQGARDFQIHRSPRPRQRLDGPEIHHPGCARRLHRVRYLRRCLSREKQERDALESHQHGRAAAAARAGARELGIFPQDSGV
jgi:pyruvate-ferredoxin/flavodoxin oxidoreductase